MSEEITAREYNYQVYEHFPAESVKDTAWKVPVQMFTDKKRGKKEEDKKLSRRIRLVS